VEDVPEYLEAVRFLSVPQSGRKRIVSLYATCLTSHRGAMPIIKRGILHECDMSVLRVDGNRSRASRPGRRRWVRVGEVAPGLSISADCRNSLNRIAAVERMHACDSASGALVAAAWK